MKMVGERPLNALLESLADVRKAKVMEAFEKATVKCKAGTGPAAAKVPPTKKAAPTKKVTAVLEDEPPKPAAVKPPPAKVAVCSITCCLYYLSLI
jgi:cytoskeleton-associated protein 5